VLAQPSSDAILAKLGIAPGGYILANSGFHAHKNLQTVFDGVAADAELARKLVLFGGPLRDELAFRGLTVPDGVRFAGRVNDANLASLMRNAALFLFPSTTEGFGLPPLEAMPLGCPTICSDAGAMPKVCGDGACLIRAGPSRLARRDRAAARRSGHAGRAVAGQPASRDDVHLDACGAALSRSSVAGSGRDARHGRLTGTRDPRPRPCAIGRPPDPVSIATTHRSFALKHN
jgi:hypothetical protein